MAGLARRLAPAAALGGLAVVIVGIADPAIAGRSDAPSQATVPTSVPADMADTVTPDASTSDAATPEAAATDSGATCNTAEAVTGPSIMTRWGPVQVAATIVDGQLCEVHAVVWPDGDRRSSEISQYAIPELDAMASEQGVEFDGISGATYTSEGYRESLQQLLDSL